MESESCASSLSSRYFVLTSTRCPVRDPGRAAGRQEVDEDGLRAVVIPWYDPGLDLVCWLWCRSSRRGCEAAIRKQGGHVVRDRTTDSTAGSPMRYEATAYFAKRGGVVTAARCKRRQRANAQLLCVVLSTALPCVTTPWTRGTTKKTIKTYVKINRTFTEHSSIGIFSRFFSRLLGCFPCESKTLELVQ